MKPGKPERAWKQLHHPAATEPSSALAELHWAAQLPARVGATLLAPEADFGHLSLTWNESAASLVTGLVTAQAPERAFRAALRPADAELLLLDLRDGVWESYPLAAHTLQEADRWLTERVAERRGETTALVAPPHEMPAHPIAEGARFGFEEAPPRRALSDWYSNIDHLLHGVRREERRAGPVRVWPHHFDIATLITLDPDRPAEEARSLGLGWSPGDSNYAQPYLYATPWPYPDANKLPEAPAGARWHSEGWVGCVLLASDLVQSEDQEQCATSFFSSARATLLELLESNPA